jgi:ATP-dependent protease ClpP protease subunit
MRPCYQFTTAKASQPAHLSIYDEIGFWGVQAKDFHASLNAIAEPELDVEINSPGGDYFAGLAMYNMLRNSGKKITTKVMGVAASAASIVFMAGDKRSMPSNTFLMVHNPSNFAGGTAKDHRETADMLDKVAIGARSVYSRDSGMKDEDIATMLDTDTWISATEAMSMGLATEVTDEIHATASFDMARADLPEAVTMAFVKAQADPEVEPAPEVAPEAEPEVPEAPPIADQIMQAATAAGMPEHGAAFVLACASLDEAKARMAVAIEITALCKAVGAPQSAAPAIRSGASLSEVRTTLAAYMANADENIDTAKPITPQTTTNNGKPPVTAASIWASHLGQK